MKPNTIIKYTDAVGRIFFLSSTDLEKTEGQIPLRSSLGIPRKDPSNSNAYLTVDIAEAKKGLLEDTQLDCIETLDQIAAYQPAAPEEREQVRDAVRHGMCDHRTTSFVRHEWQAIINRCDTCGKVIRTID